MSWKATEKAQAIARAKLWWKRKNPDGTYVCDGCNGSLKYNDEGSSLVGSYMRCKKCTDRIFGP
ncbi:MAG: hypothetical protein OEY99_00130 [Aigarchaeota archaeon]|nr:hypothetical protein [Aigarchaeota archaeon]